LAIVIPTLLMYQFQSNISILTLVLSFISTFFVTSIGALLFFDTLISYTIFKYKLFSLFDETSKLINDFINENISIEKLESLLENIVNTIITFVNDKITTNTDVLSRFLEKIKKLFIKTFEIANYLINMVINCSLLSKNYNGFFSKYLDFIKWTIKTIWNIIWKSIKIFFQRLFKSTLTTILFALLSIGIGVLLSTVQLATISIVLIISISLIFIIFIEFIIDSFRFIFNLNISKLKDILSFIIYGILTSLFISISTFILYLISLPFIYIADLLVNIFEKISSLGASGFGILSLSIFLLLSYKHIKSKILLLVSTLVVLITLFLESSLVMFFIYLFILTLSDNLSYKAIYLLIITTIVTLMPNESYTILVEYAMILFLIITDFAEKENDIIKVPDYYSKALKGSYQDLKDDI